MVNSWRSLLLALLLLALWVMTATAASVQAVADRDRVALGESLQLQLRVDGSPDGEPDLTALEQSWELLSQSQSSQMQFINGSFSRSVVYNLILMPRAQGMVTIPSICFGQNCSLPLPIEVSDVATSSAGSDSALILETEASSQKVVTEGQLLLKVRLLRRVDLTAGQLKEPNPTGVSAIVKKLGDDRSYETRRDGQLYQVIERNYAIFPQGVGQMLIPALQFDGRIASSRSRFDPFGQQGQRVRRTSQPLQVEVTPLPTDLSRRPWIPAAALDLQDDWQQHPPKLVVGEPATRTLLLRASGVQASQLPELKPGVPDGFKTYPDQPKRDDQLNNNGITGMVEQKIAMIPTRAGHFTLPAVDLDWWDVSTDEWKSVHLAALELEVAPAPGVAVTSPPPMQPAPEDKSPLQQPASNIPLKPLPANTAPTSAKAATNIWPWISLALAFVWAFTLILLWRRRREPDVVQSSPDLQTTEKVTRKAVVQAARRHDPQATRQALLAWSRSLWPELPSGSYGRLSKAAGQELDAELATLDRSLYGRTTLAWNGDRLAELVSKWQKGAQVREGSVLPELYPEIKLTKR